MKVILSIGNGRLHLINSARYISRPEIDLRLICGFIPKKIDTLFIRFASFLARRDVSHGMKCRMVTLPNVEIKTCGWSEVFFLFLRTLAQRLHISTHAADYLGWFLFGCASRKYIDDAQIFHCRSGAGQGGAIEKAKRKGMRVLVDHSAMHPTSSGQILEDEYKKWNLPVAISESVGVWRHVIRDCRQADMLMVNSEHIKRSFVANGFPAEKIRVVYLGVREDFNGLRLARDWQSDYTRDKPLRVLYTGGFSLLKGAEYLLESARVLMSRGAAVEYHIVGALDIPRDLRERYRDCPVVYHGVVPQDELVGFFQSSDVYVFPSLADGCAQSGMEAMSAGLPVITTLNSGLPICDGVTGIIIPVKDAAAIADKVEYLKNNPDVMLRLGTAASKMLKEEFTWERYGDKVRKLYDELANGS